MDYRECFIDLIKHSKSKPKNEEDNSNPKAEEPKNEKPTEDKPTE